MSLCVPVDNVFHEPLPLDSQADVSDVDSGSNASEEAEDSAVDETKPQPGMRAETKNLYEGHPKCGCCINWIEKLPQSTLDSIKASKKTREYAVIVRHRKATTALDGELKLDSIIVQSPLLKPILTKAFEGLSGVVASLDRLEFSSPFAPFFHRWAEFEEARSEAQGETRVHADLLYDILHKQIEQDIKASSDLIKHGAITFDYLWTLFTPGELLVCSQGGQNSARMIIRPEYFRDPNNKEITAYTVICRYIDVGRLGLGYATSALILPRFSGMGPISELMFEDVKDQTKDGGVLAMPAKSRPDFDTLRTTLIARGRRFEELKGYHYKQYDGDMEEKVRRPRKEVAISRRISSRIVIDGEAYENHALDTQINLLPLATDILAHNDDSAPVYDEDDGYYANTMRDKIRFRMKNIKRESSRLTDDQLMICSPKVKGYSLKTKAWGEFFVDYVHDIAFHKDAFDSIVLAENYKELISSFVTRHLSNTDTFDDFIPGKGRGLIILLSGEPGVGKTLTAESVAEEMQAPLYALGAGELGSQADDVDRKLNDVLELCTRWRAVLLLDEADVFLEQRSTSDMERNKIVSVFLRVLEYYEGMMFMTTNRVSAFDAAFRSRIHINMDYPPLNAAARKAIWSKFLNGSTGHGTITAEQVNALSEKPMNGREIKNSIKIASLLAGHKKEPLGLGHLSTVLAANGFGGDGGYVLENDFRVF